MIVIRPITKKDKESYINFSFNASIGIRSLPKDVDRLEAKINASELSFARNVIKPENEEYLFVLEDISTGKLEGVCGILAARNPNETCSFQLKTIAHPSPHPSITKEIKILEMAKINSQVSEICSLYLLPTFRHSGQGRLLSLSRFLFIASHRQRFKSKIIAEMRGYINEKQVSPLWEAIGRHFCNIPFSELMTLIDQRKISIQSIIPHYPFYVDLLPHEAQQVLGKTHDSSVPALNMLLSEGFQQINEIDAFEGGPTLISPVSKVRTIKHSKLIKITITQEEINEGLDFILANTRIDFRACYGRILFSKKGHGIIHQSVADALQVTCGEFIRYVSPH